MPHIWTPHHIYGSQICKICESITRNDFYYSPDVLVKMPVDLLLKKSKILSKDEKSKLYTCEEIVALRVIEE